jgi:hypothetical protein
LLGASRGVLLGSSALLLVWQWRVRGVRAIRSAWRLGHNWQGAVSIRVAAGTVRVDLRVARIDGDSESPRMLLSARRLAPASHSADGNPR